MKHRQGAFTTEKNIHVQLLLFLSAAEYDEPLKRRALVKGWGGGEAWGGDRNTLAFYPCAFKYLLQLQSVN